MEKNPFISQEQQDEARNKLRGSSLEHATLEGVDDDGVVLNDHTQQEKSGPVNNVTASALGVEKKSYADLREEAKAGVEDRKRQIAEEMRQEDEKDEKGDIAA